MSFALKRALQVLQMPLLELSSWLENELEQNPVLEVVLPKGMDDLSWIRSEETLFEYLEKEIFLHFTSSKERSLALFIAGSLNTKGFLTLSEKEICRHEDVSSAFFRQVIKRFHQIEPIGLGARDVREALLLQLIAKDQKKTRLYRIVDEHFDDLIHNRLQHIAKALHLSVKTVKKMIETELKRLDPFPGHRFSQDVIQEIVPDLCIEKEEDMWKVEVYGDCLPVFHIHPEYHQCLKEKTLAKEELHFIRRHLASGKWLKRTLDRRKKILIEIGNYLLKKQLSFLEGIEQTPEPLTRREMASHLGLSESTVTRALHQKYVSCPRGLIPLSDFFSHGIQTDAGLISNRAAKNLLLGLIQNENKSAPLSDQALSEELQAKGVPCARRTIAKYRRELKIASCYKRREWT